MHSQLVVVDNIKFSKEHQKHDIGHILHDITIPALPYVYTFQMLIALKELPDQATFELQLKIKDRNGKDVGISSPITMYHERKNEQSSEMETSLKMSMVLSLEGTYTAELYYDGEVITTHPVHVRLEQAS
ncbi:DUF6941 family protein [Brevibacillus laterosporus]|uniref:Uncharacterized protein n=1 Tax=Brevibacillus laterosporus TaxID=1465 RepID=A0A0F7EJ45_BRELA|nr:hypothetical protein [Brevibacillus laterosporus]AKF95755.1 hypothetical protein EX87_19205 [Brevibacillus laterosporus]